jgi:hypothetical protein
MMRFCYVGILISTMSCFEFFFGSRLYVSKLFVIYIYIMSAICLAFFILVDGLIR